MSIESLHRFLSNDRNDAAAATLTASSVLPAADAAFLRAGTRAGNARAIIGGAYTGANDCVLDIEILSATGTGLLSDPVFSGAGNGALTDLSASGLTAQDFTVTLADTGTITKPAALDFFGVKLLAKAVGAAGDGITLRVDTSGITATATVYSFLEDATAGTSEFTGPEWDFGAKTLNADGEIAANSPRLRFGFDPQIYRQYKEFVDGAWTYIIDPPLVRDLPAETRVYAVTGTYTVTVTDTGPIAPLVETYSAIITLFDLLNAIKTRSTLLAVDGVVVEDKTPGGMAAEDLPARTDAYALPASYTGNAQWPGLGAVTVANTAPTEVVTLTCANVSTLGREVWTVAGSVSGNRGNCTTGIAYAQTPYGWTVPVITPEAGAAPTGKISVKSIAWMPGHFEVGAPAIELCVSPLIAGAKAKKKTIEVVYARKPPDNDCPCTSAVVSGNLDPKCLGVDIDDEDLGMALTAGYQARLETLQAWLTAFMASNAEITAQGELRTADYDRQLAEYAHEELLSCLADLYNLGTLTATPWAAATAKTVDAVVEPTTRNGYRYRCTVAGTTHATTQPTWPVTPGTTVTDGTVTWKCVSKVPEYAWDDLLAAVDSELSDLEGIGAEAPGIIDFLDQSTAYTVGDVVWTRKLIEPARYADDKTFLKCVVSGTTGVSKPPTAYWQIPVQYGTSDWDEITAAEAGALVGADTADINAISAVTSDPGISRDPKIFATKFKASCNQVRALAGLLPKADAGLAGSECWQPCDGDYYWALNDQEYLPACTNVPYHSCIKVYDAEGEETIVSTQEFGFVIRCACPDRLIAGDKFVIEIESDAAPAKAYAEGDTIRIPVIASQPLELENGVTGNDTLTWSVRGSVAGQLPDYVAPIGSEPLYDDGEDPNQLIFKISQGGVPFALGDTYLFTVAGGTFQWRKDGAAWTGPVTIASGATTLSDGLTVTLQPGADPAFVAGDDWTFDIQQPHSPDLTQSPARGAWRWSGTGATLTATFAADKTLTAFAIWHDCPAGATFTLQGLSAADAVLWTKAITYRSKLTAALFEGTGAVVACRKLKLTVASATGGSIKWLWAGAPWMPSHPASSITLAESWQLRRGFTAARYQTRGAAGEIAWEIQDHSWIESTDRTNLQTLLDYSKQNNDQPFIFVANRDFPEEARLVRIGADEVSFSDRFQFQYTPRRVLNVRIPLAAVPL